MELLFNDTLAPITSTIGFLKIDLETLCAGFWNGKYGCMVRGD